MPRCYTFSNSERVKESIKSVNIKLEEVTTLFTAHSASETALAVVKAGAQRLQRLYYPFVQTRPIIFAYSLLPETVSTFIRYIWKPTE